MAIIRRKTTAKKTTTPKKSRKSIPHIVDGIAYKSGTLVKYHNEMKQAIAGGWITSFTLPQIGDGQKKSKFGAYKAEVDGRIFDSVMEARFYVYLKGLQASGSISSFECQVGFELQPKFRDKFTHKVILPINYIADFVITMPDDSKIVVDTKGIETADFLIKKKIMRYKFPDLRFMCVQWVAGTQSWEDLEDIKKERRAKKRAAAAKTKTQKNIQEAG